MHLKKVCVMITSLLSLFSLHLYSIHTIDDPIDFATSEWKNIDFSKSSSSSSVEAGEAALRDVKILIHGWNANSNHISIQPVRNAYLKRNVSHVLAVDWKEIADLPYIVARDLIALVGGKVCKQLKEFTATTKISVDRLHIVGHSLGCHIATHVGRCFNGQIGR
jgi:pimeloyl-ACP methyl ester carboxylesterase